MIGIATTTEIWKAGSETIGNLPVTYSTVPITPPSSEGKFFRVWSSHGYCMKWLKSNVLIKPYSGIPEIAAISLVLEAASLTPQLLFVQDHKLQKVTGVLVMQLRVPMR